jgi:hypothetical protein
VLQNTPVHAGLPLVRDVLPKSDWPLLTVVMAMETFGLPVIAPPNTPPDRLAELRRAFLQMCDDRAYRMDAEKIGLPVGAPISGEKMAQMVRDLTAAATPAIVARYKQLAGAN